MPASRPLPTYSVSLVNSRHFRPSKVAPSVEADSSDLGRLQIARLRHRPQIGHLFAVGTMQGYLSLKFTKSSMR